MDIIVGLSHWYRFIEWCSRYSFPWKGLNLCGFMWLSFAAPVQQRRRTRKPRRQMSDLGWHQDNETPRLEVLVRFDAFIRQVMEYHQREWTYIKLLFIWSPNPQTWQQALAIPTFCTVKLISTGDPNSCWSPEVIPLLWHQPIGCPSVVESDGAPKNLCKLVVEASSCSFHVEVLRILWIFEMFEMFETWNHETWNFFGRLSFVFKRFWAAPLGGLPRFQAAAQGKGSKQKATATDIRYNRYKT